MSTKLDPNNYTLESIKEYREACMRLIQSFNKLNYEAKKNYDQVTKELYDAKISSLLEAEGLLVLK